MSNRSTLSIFVIRTFGPEISVHWMLVILLACITLAMVSCAWLTTSDSFDFVADEGESQPVPTQTRESGSTTLRNLGLLLAGVFALALATWRSVAADRQSKATKEQSATANRSLWNERFQKGIEMLAHDLLSMRLGGIYALHHLGVDSTEHERARIDQSLCAFVRLPPGYVAPGTTMREDIQAIMYGFCIRDRSNPQTTKPESTEARRPCR